MKNFILGLFVAGFLIRNKRFFDKVATDVVEKIEKDTRPSEAGAHG